MRINGDVSVVESSDIARAGRVLNRKMLLLCTIAGLFVGYVVLGPATGGEAKDNLDLPAAINDSTNQTVSIRQPDPSLSPKQVVEIQMRALVDFRSEQKAIRQVFAFASPSNRSVTGPLSRFERMISRPPFAAMVDCNHWMSGGVVRQDDLATVLVTTTDDSNRVSLYRFYLRLQADEYADCWMTDRVVCVFQSGRIEPTDSI
ncbi:MAG: hypothetical protein AAGD11_08840 [Planctomycetota bacterium]